MRWGAQIIIITIIIIIILLLIIIILIIIIRSHCGERFASASGPGS